MEVSFHSDPPGWWITAERLACGELSGPPRRARMVGCGPGSQRGAAERLVQDVRTATIPAWSGTQHAGGDRADDPVSGQTVMGLEVQHVCAGDRAEHVIRV